MIDAASRAEGGRLGHTITMVVMATAAAHAMLLSMIPLVPTAAMVVLTMVSMWRLVVVR